MIPARYWRFGLGSLVAAAAILSGCAVPQPRGHGSRFFLKEPGSGRGYFVYLPAGYDPSLTWPMVLSLHGMKPFDHAESQQLEWETMADKHRMVVLAPDLNNSDLFMQYPMKKITNGVKRDEQIVMRIVQDVIKRCHIDPARIYATSWSSGGYLLHYLVVNNPDTFAGVCARGSCFSLDSVNSIPRKKIRRLAERRIPVMIYYGSNDFGGVRRESRQAIAWYKNLKIPVTANVVDGKGHERVPDLAANFFAKHGGTARSVRAVKIAASYERGIAPFWVNFTARLPNVQLHTYRRYKFAWYVNDKLQGTEPTWFGTLYKPGKNVVRVEVTAPDNAKFQAEKTVLVLPRPPTGLVQ